MIVWSLCVEPCAITNLYSLLSTIMSLLQTAIQHYHDLALSESVAQGKLVIMVPGMKERHLFFGDRPICTVFRPLFHTGSRLPLVQLSVLH